MKIARTTLICISFFFLLSCNDTDTKTSGETAASENQENLIMAGIVGYYATKLTCVDVDSISISSAAPQSHTFHETWLATGCGKEQKFSVSFQEDSATVRVDPSS